jgi:uncharacterized repeat protein (TIGR03803 family)
MGIYVTAQHKVLYGETTEGGKYNYGTLFRFDLTAGKDSVLFSFSDTNGNSPQDYLLMASNGVLYGTTELGGRYSNSIDSEGVFFSYNPLTNKESTVFEFNGANGSFPAGRLIQDSTGLIYCTTGYGGTIGGGVIIRYDPIKNKDTVVFNFGDTTTGCVEYGGLTYASSNLFYGMTEECGKFNDGVIFSFNPKTNSENVLFNFNGTNGFFTEGYLIDANDSLLYGLTGLGGTKNKGVLFNFDPKTDSENVLVNFDSLNGAIPYGSLFQATNGLLYGVATKGGVNNGGVLFSYDIAKGKDSILISFGNFNNGRLPYSNLIEDSSNGTLYGMVSSGGIYGFGYIYSYNINNSKDSLLFSFNGIDGSTPSGSLLLAKDTLTGINELIEKKEEVIVYPNPSNGLFNFNISNYNQGIKNKIEIYNVLGEKVYQFAMDSTQFTISLVGQPSGVYMYRITSESGDLVASGKLIIQ